MQKNNKMVDTLSYHNAAMKGNVLVNATERRILLFLSNKQLSI